MRLGQRSGWRVLLAALVASTSWADPPKKFQTLEDLRAKELTEAIADVTAKREGACLRLNDALEPFWAAEDAAARLEWPRVMRTPLPKVVAGLREAGNACAELALAADEQAEWSVSRLLRSAVLQDEALRKKAIEKGLASGTIGRSSTGGIVSLTRGGGATFVPPAHVCVDPTEATPKMSGPGALAPELVQKVIRNNRAQAFFCCDANFRRLQGRRGVVTVQFAITQDGEHWHQEREPQPRR